MVEMKLMQETPTEMLQAFKVLSSRSAEHLGPVEGKAAGNRMH